jgi:hypothetical protein
MSSTKNPGRFAGLLYILMSIPGFFAMVYVPSKLIVHENAAATANNITAFETLYRLGIEGQLICQVGFIFVALALYDLLKGINQRLALLWVILVVVAIPIAFLNELNSIAALALVRGADFLSIFEKPQREALAILFLNLHNEGLGVVEILWGVGLVPLGLLVYRSGFLPRFLGGRLACHRRLRLRDVKPYERTVAALLQERLCNLPGRALRGGGVHAVARHQGRQAASAGRRSPSVGGCLEAAQKREP